MYEWHQEEYYSDSPSPAAFVAPAAPPKQGRQQRAAQQPKAPAAAASGARQAKPKGQVIHIQGGKRKASPAPPQPHHEHSGSNSSTTAAAAAASSTTAGAAQHHHQVEEEASSACVAESVAGGSWVGRMLGPYIVLYDPEIAPHCGYACMLHLAGQSINMAHVRSLRSHVYSVLATAAQAAALIEGRSVLEWAEIYEEDVDTFVASTLQCRAANLLDLHVLASSMKLKVKLVRFDGEELAQVGRPQDSPAGVICPYQSHFVVVAEQPTAEAAPEHAAAQKTDSPHSDDSDDNLAVIALVNQNAQLHSSLPRQLAVPEDRQVHPDTPSSRDGFSDLEGESEGSEQHQQQPIRDHMTHAPMSPPLSSNQEINRSEVSRQQQEDQQQ
eukprot:2869081-Amphidinium_carterae.2